MKKVIQENGEISEHCLRTVHAEQNAICQAAKRGISIEGATVYTRMTPCRTCAMLLRSSVREFPTVSRTRSRKAHRRRNSPHYTAIIDETKA